VRVGDVPHLPLGNAFPHSSRPDERAPNVRTECCERGDMPSGGRPHRHRGLRHGHSVLAVQLLEECSNSVVDLVTDAAHGIERFRGRVIELPVFVSLAGVVRAGVTAAHRDDNVGGCNR